MQNPDEITLILHRLARGERGAQDRLFELIYPQLRRSAAAYLARERKGHTLQPTALVHEAFLRVPREGIDWQSRVHFFAVAASAMRRVLVDYARAHSATKRGDGNKVEFSENLIYDSEKPEYLLDLNRALNHLFEMEPRQARVVEMRFFGGLTDEEIATALNVTARTVKRDWRIARTWLFGELSNANQSTDSRTKTN